MSGSIIAGAANWAVDTSTRGRYKSFPIQDEPHLYEVLRYVEANPVRARLVGRGRDWLWSSLSPAPLRGGLLDLERPRLQPWTRNAAWEREVDQPMEADHLHLLQQSVIRGTPYGEAGWVSRFVAKHGMETTLRKRGRPKKQR